MNKKSGKGLAISLAAFALVGGGGVFAYKYIFNRPGESAIALLPADCGVIITLDTNPSERQVTVFRKIGDTLDKNHFAANFDSMATKFMQDNPVVSKLRPLLTNNFAIGRWNVGSTLDHGVVIVSLKDAAAAQKIIDESEKFRGTSMKVIKGYLVFSDKEADCARVQNVVDGKVDSAVTVNEFGDARKALPEDANLMVFASYDKIGKGNEKQFKVGTNGYLAFSATIEDEGIAFDSYGISKPTEDKLTKLMDKLQPMDEATYKGLPRGAYGALGFTGLSISIEAMRLSLGQSSETREAWDNGVKSFEKSSGLSLDEDLIPALSGTCALAVYPGASGKPEDLDVVLAMQNEDPDHLKAVAAKLREKSSQIDAEAAEPLKWSTGSIEGNVFWNLVIPANSQPADGPFKGKSLAYVETETGITFGSSVDVIRKSVASSKGVGDLANDPGYAAAWSHEVKGSYSTFVLNLNRIMNAFKPSIERSSGNSKDVQDWMNLFGSSTDALVLSAKIENGITTGKGFLPLDWEAAARLMGRGMQSIKDSTSGRRNHFEDEAMPTEDGEVIVK